MWDLNPNGRDDRQHLRRIREALRRRGLTPDLSKAWEVNVPNSMPDRRTVYVGWAEEDKSKTTAGLAVSSVCVAIYPWAVYEIARPVDWSWGGKRIRTVR